MTEFNKDMAAVAFAEAGESGEARKMTGGGPALKPAMAKPKKKKPYLGTLVFGAISLTAYIILIITKLHKRRKSSYGHDRIQLQKNPGCL